MSTGMRVFMGLAFVVAVCMSMTGCAGCGCQSVKPAEREKLRPCDFHPMRPVSVKGHTWTGWETKNDGPLVVLLHEITGLSQSSLHLAKALSEGPERCHVVMPVLFGKFGEHRPKYQFIAALVRALGNRWDIFSSESLGTVEQEAVEFCAEISRRNQGRRMVIIGNCLTGSWPIALLREPFVCGGIICQPALPFQPLSDKARRGLGITESNLQKVAAIVKAEHKPVLGIRYLHDKFVKEALPMKFERLHDLLGDQFHSIVMAEASDKGRVLPPSIWIEADCSCGHSTLTENAGLTKSKERGPLLTAANTLIKRAHGL